MNSQTTLNATSSQGLEDGPSLFDWQDGPTLFPCGPDLAHASRSVRPVSEKESPTNATSGRTSADSSRPESLQSRLESRLRARLDVNGSLEYELTWKRWPMKSGLPICALRASTRRTSASASIGWPTPQARDHFPAHPPEYIAEKKAQGHGMANLNDTVQLAAWPTPMAGTPAQKGYNAAGNTDYSRRVVDLAGWPTPTSSMMTEQDVAQAMTAGNSEARKPYAESVIVVGWPTTRANDGTGAQECKGRTGGPSLKQVAALGINTNSSNAQTEKRGALNPAHSRWLMGFPAEWDSCGATAMQSCRKTRRSS